MTLQFGGFYVSNARLKIEQRSGDIEFACDDEKDMSPSRITTYRAAQAVIRELLDGL